MGKGKKWRNGEQGEKRKGLKIIPGWVGLVIHPPPTLVNPSSIQIWAKSNLAYSWIGDPGYSASSSSSEVSSNKQRVSNNKDHQEDCSPNMFTQHMEFTYTGKCPCLEIILLHCSAPLLFPPWAPPLPSLLSPPVSATSLPAMYPKARKKQTLSDY